MTPLLPPPQDFTREALKEIALQQKVLFDRVAQLNTKYDTIERTLRDIEEYVSQGTEAAAAYVPDSTESTSEPSAVEYQDSGGDMTQGIDWGGWPGQYPRVDLDQVQAAALLTAIEHRLVKGDCLVCAAIVEDFRERYKQTFNEAPPES